MCYLCVIVIVIMQSAQVSKCNYVVSVLFHNPAESIYQLPSSFVCDINCCPKSHCLAVCCRWRGRAPVILFSSMVQLRSFSDIKYIILFIGTYIYTENQSRLISLGCLLQMTEFTVAVWAVVNCSRRITARCLDQLSAQCVHVEIM